MNNLPPEDLLRLPPSPDSAPAGRRLPGTLGGPASLRPGPSGSRALVRIAAPELARRAQLEKTRGRLVVAAGGFALLFGAVSLKLAFATLLDPMTPKLRPAAHMPTPGETAIGRAPITDRNGEVLAVSLQVTELYANPQEINDAEAAADRLLRVLPNLDRDRLVARITRRNVPGTERPVEFAYIARNLPPRQQQAINDLGVPGFHFRPAERRFYPQGSRRRACARPGRRRRPRHRRRRAQLRRAAADRARARCGSRSMSGSRWRCARRCRRRSPTTTASAAPAW